MPGIPRPPSGPRSPAAPLSPKKGKKSFFVRSWTASGAGSEQSRGQNMQRSKFSLNSHTHLKNPEKLGTAMKSDASRVRAVSVVLSRRLWQALPRAEVLGLAQLEQGKHPKLHRPPREDVSSTGSPTVDSRQLTHRLWSQFLQDQIFFMVIQFSILSNRWYDRLLNKEINLLSKATRYQQPLTQNFRYQSDPINGCPLYNQNLFAKAWASLRVPSTLISTPLSSTVQFIQYRKILSSLHSRINFHLAFLQVPLVQELR